MRVITVNGHKHSGKTTICQSIISTLRERGYSVGSAKEMYREFLIDHDEKNSTYRQRLAGSQLITGRILNETDIMYLRRLTLEEILAVYDQDFVILESVRDCLAPRIIAAHNIEEISEHHHDAVAISGIVSNTDLKEYNGLPIINPFEEADKLADIVEKYAIEPLPSTINGECGRCGYSCKEMLSRIIKGEAKRSDCPYSRQEINILNNGNSIILSDEDKKVIRDLMAKLSNGNPAKIDIRITE